MEFWAIPKFGLKKMTPTEVFILAILWTRKNGDNVAWPSQEYLTWATGLKKRQIINVLTSLKESGYIKSFQRGKRRSNLYYLNMDKIYQESKDWIEDVKRKMDKKVAKFGKGDVQSIAPPMEVQSIAPPIVREQVVREHKVLAGDTVSSRDIIEIITLFKEINPNAIDWFGHKTYRTCIARLIEKLNVEKVKELVGALKFTNIMPFAPRITTPKILENKYADLIAFIQQQKNIKTINQNWITKL